MDAAGFLQLLTRARAGDSGAVEGLLEKVRPYLRAIAGKYIDSGRASRSVSDLTQDVELLVWRNLDRFSSFPGDDEVEAFARFRAWLSTIVRRHAANVHRERNTEKRRPPGRYLRRIDHAGDGAPHHPGAPSSPDPTASARCADRELVERVHLAIDKLADEDDRALIRLHYFDGLSLLEISRRLDLPYHKVKTRFHRGVEFLERELGGLL